MRARSPVPYSPEKRKAYDAQRKRRSAHYSAFQRGRFIGWDGEGINNLDPGKPKEYGHRYAFLASSTGARTQAKKVGMGTRDSLDTLMDEHLRLKANRIKPIHVCYGLSYDANMWLRELDRDTVSLIWGAVPPKEKREEEQPKIISGKDGLVEFRIDGRRYGTEYRKRKSFYLQRFRAPNRRWIQNEKGDFVKDMDSLTVWDVQGFFQCPFVDALQEYFRRKELGDDLAKLSELKGMRDVFSYAMLPKIIAYNDLELAWLVKLMDRLRDHLDAVNLPVRAWHGAGAIASAIILRENVKAHHEYDPMTHEDAIRRAYFGGRIEIGGIGRITAPFFHADQNAAYPSAMVHLPSLADARWYPAPGDAPASDAAMILRRIRWEFPEGIHWYPLPYRSPQFSTCYPARGAGWAWDGEYDAAQAFVDRYGGGIEVAETISIVPASRVAPFAFIPAMYAQRKALEKNNDGAAQAIKMGMASLYGKMAQQLGGRIEDDGTKNFPPLFSQAWAGWVTAATRGKLVHAALALEDDRDLVFFSTDGIVATSPIGVPYGENLDEWSQDCADELIVCEPGIYWTRKGQGGEWEAHGRGYMSGELDSPEPILRAWKAKHRTYRVHLRRFLTMGSALVSEEMWEEWCEWADTWRELDLTGSSSKRHGRLKKDGSPASKWIPLTPMKSTEYEYMGTLSHPAPLLWDDNAKPEEFDAQGVPLRTVEYECIDAYT